MIRKGCPHLQRDTHAHCIGVSQGALTEEDAEQAREKADALNKANAKDYIDKVASRVKLKGAKVQGDVINGDAAESLADYAANNGVDLIVMATHGRSGISRWFIGSVADRLIRTARVPVLVVRAPGSEPEG